MLHRIRAITLLAATLTTGMIAGLFYSFFYSVMPGLNNSDDHTFVEAMQEINTAILNGWFGLAFGGAVLFGALAVLLVARKDTRPVLPWAIAGFACYLLTVFVTMGFNVPLNDQLAAAGDPDSISNLASVREEFETTWVAWNTVRSATATTAFACLGWALVKLGGTKPAQQ